MPRAENTLLRPEVWRAPDGSVGRLVVIKPGMCGHNSLFVGQVGDWTWETVSELCDTTPRGQRRRRNPTYLSFYYYRVRASREFHLRRPTFGDGLDVTSRAFDFGSESVLTLHRIPGSRRRRDGPSPGPGRVLRRRRPTPVRGELQPLGHRSQAGSNEDLVPSSPPDFRHAHLPPPARRVLARLAYGRARRRLTFRGGPGG